MPKPKTNIKIAKKALKGKEPKFQLFVILPESYRSRIHMARYTHRVDWHQTVKDHVDAVLEQLGI